eukprot:UN24206
MEVEQLKQILNYITDRNYERITLYLISCASYLPVPDNTNTLTIVYEILLKQKQPVQALRMAIKLDDSEKVKDIFNTFEDVTIRKQLAYFLTWCQYPLPFDEEEQEELWGDDEYDTFEEILSNKNMHETYLELARELDVVEPKTPEDIYKEHLTDLKSNETVLSAKKNLASTYVNAFVNCGFQNDKLMSSKEAKGDWIYKNKD